MKQALHLFVLFLLLSVISTAQLKSPQQFLGYEPGKEFTPHYKIVQYFEHAAASSPSMMKLEKYGKTNEGRDLLLAVVSSPENIARLEDIRMNNLRLTGLQPGTGNPNAPVIVWLSYNVHGNEASSSEVSMSALYEFLNSSNPEVRSWLNNTVVIIDPCLNPDGRDRYVNWYRSVAGRQPNADPDAAEHKEPWPGGRPNHYLFDLNRDWAWQTQVETQARVKKYNEWMPQIHADFHEQDPGNPYYFAPAAEPFHEVITSWQRDFQVTIGRNHAKYFDEKGWLYFTKEYFDLFYPSYGDTYPLYNGSIGMTYEQAGHGKAGLAFALPGDDTLKLSDRIAHHLATTISTVESSSKNAQALLNNFKKYFDDARNGSIGEYKTYVIPSPDENRITSLKTLFDRNKIQYSIANKPVQIKGYNFLSGKEENYAVRNGDMLVSASQPKGALVKVLFEPSSKLSDSSTYDITAWSLPYAYGLAAFATRQSVGAGSDPGSVVPASLPVSNYGYLVNYNSFEDGKLLATLLKNNFRVRFSEKEFTYAGKKYGRGSLIILRAGNEAHLPKLLDIARKYNAAITAVSSGFMDAGSDFGSDKIHLIRKPSVALMMGDQTSYTATGEIWHLFEQQLEYPLTLINSGDFDAGDLNQVNVLIIPRGYYKFLGTKESSADLKAWVRNGGKLIVLEEAATQLAGLEWGFKLKKQDEEKQDADKKDVYADLKRFEDRERDPLVNNIPGAIYRVTLDNSHPLAFGYLSYYYTLKLNDHLFEFSRDAWNVGVIKKEMPVSGFVGSKVKEKIKDGTAMGVMSLGRGSVVYFTDDPVFRSFWENGKLLLTNAIFLVGQ